MIFLKRIIFLWLCLILFNRSKNCQKPPMTYESFIGEPDLELTLLPAPFSFNSNNKDVCYKGEFHPDSLRRCFKNVQSTEDCIVLCRNLNDCSAAVYFMRLKECYIASPLKERIMSSNLPESFIFMKGVDAQYCIPADIKQQKLTYSIVLNSGETYAACGQPHYPFHIKRHKRIIGGGEASFYSLPWMVSLSTWSDDHVCGGSLIALNNNLASTRFILTAAHCVVKTYTNKGGLELRHLSLDAIVGSHDLRFTEAHEKRLVIKKAIVHPLCKDMSSIFLWNILNDIAVLELEGHINFNNYIRPICLPIPEDNIKQNVAECFVAGWGVPSNEDDSPNDQLKAASYKILRDENAKLIATGGQPPNYGRLATYDSGGPLFCETSFQTYTIFGVVNHGMNKPNKLGLFEDTFANVLHHTQWIEYVMDNDEHLTKKTGLVYEFEEKMDF